MRAKTRSAPMRRERSSEASRPSAAVLPASESEALEAARHGDLNAWAAIVRGNQELVFGSAYLVARDSTIAVRATKGVFERAYRSLPGLEADAALQPWLLRLTDTITRSGLRETVQRRDTKVPEPDPYPRLAATPFRLPAGTPVPSPAERQALADAFEGLVDADRSTIAARYAFGLGRDAAASRLGLDADELDRHLATSLQRLRKRALEELAGADGPAEQRPTVAPSPPARLAALSEEQLGSMAMAVVISELSWTPDVAAAVCDRLARETVAYGAMPASSAPATQHDGAAGKPPTSSDAPSRRRRSGGFSAGRSLGLAAGVALLVLTFAVAGAGAGDQAPAMLADMRAGLGSLMGEPVDPPRSTAGVATVTPGSTSVVSTVPAPRFEDTVTAVADPAPASPAASVAGARRLGNGSLRGVVRVDWSAEQNADAPVRARVEHQTGNSGWVSSPWADARLPLHTELEPGSAYRLRVRTVDAAGEETISPVARVKLAVRGARSDRLVRSKGDWETRRGPSGQRRLIATAPGARVSTQFSGSDVAFLARLSPDREAVGIRIDDRALVRDPEPIAQAGRVALFREGLDQGRHSLEIQALGGGLAVDAILILRTLSA